MNCSVTHQSSPLLNSVTGNLLNGNLDGQEMSVNLQSQ